MSDMEHLPDVVSPRDIESVPLNPLLVEQLGPELARQVSSLQASVTTVRQATLRIADLIDEFPDDLFGMAAARYVLRYLMDDLKVVDHDAEDRLVELMPKNKTEVPGLGMLTRNSNSRWTDWDVHTIKKTLVASLVVNENGEAIDQHGDPTDEYEIQRAIGAEQMFDLIHELGRVEWRAGGTASSNGLRDKGLNLEDVADRKASRKTVTMPKRAD